MSITKGAAKRISILLPHLYGGGAERISINLANALIERGFQVDMVLMAAAGDLLGDLHAEVRIVDLKASRIRTAIVPLLKYFRESRPTAMLACMWPLTLPAILARALSCVPARLVLAEHTTWSHEQVAIGPLKQWIVRLTMRLMYPFSNGVIAVSKCAADDLSKFSGLDRKEISMIYNPVVGERKQFADEVHEPHQWWIGPHMRVLAVGTLKYQKNYPFLLEAFAQLRKRTNARLLILGEGKCRAELEEKVKTLGVDADVFMPGFIKDTAPFYARADLHVLSSIYEGLPTVIIEALNAGTPVVSVDCPSGPREILNDGEFGRLIPVGDVNAFASAMGEFLEKEHDTVALKARSQDFSISKAVDEYLALLLPDSSESRSSRQLA